MRHERHKHVPLEPSQRHHVDHLGRDRPCGLDEVAPRRGELLHIAQVLGWRGAVVEPLARRRVKPRRTAEAAVAAPAARHVAVLRVARRDRERGPDTHAAAREGERRERAAVREHDLVCAPVVRRRRHRAAEHRPRRRAEVGDDDGPAARATAAARRARDRLQQRDRTRPEPDDDDARDRARVGTCADHADRGEDETDGAVPQRRVRERALGRRHSRVETRARRARRDRRRVVLVGLAARVKQHHGRGPAAAADLDARAAGGTAVGDGHGLGGLAVGGGGGLVGLVVAALSGLVGLVVAALSVVVGLVVAALVVRCVGDRAKEVGAPPMIVFEQQVSDREPLRRAARRVNRAHVDRSDRAAAASNS